MTWSPNSQWLAYATLSAPSNFRAYIHRPDDNEPWSLSDIMQPQSFPLWRPTNDPRGSVPPIVAIPFPLVSQPGQGGVTGEPVRVVMPGLPWVRIGLALLSLFALIFVGRWLLGRSATRITITKPQVSNLRVQRTLDQLFKQADTVPGGTAAAIRHELKTGELVGGKSHIKKGQDRARELARRMREENLSIDDRKLVEHILNDLLDSLKPTGFSLN